VLVGCAIGSVVSCTNIYMSLKIGLSFGASIISAVLGFAIFSAFGARLSVLETNTTQTTGSAAGYMSTAAGLVAAVPAMNMLGHEIPGPTLLLWAIGVAFLGVFFAVPLRRQMVEIDQLRFPSGTATAETIVAMHGEAGEAIAKARVLVACGVAAGLFTLGSYFVPQLMEPHVHEWLGIGALAVAAHWTFTLYLGPSLIGVAMITGPRVVLSWVFGAILAWGIVGPIVQHLGWAPNESVTEIAGGARGWFLWPGVALMVSESLTTLAMSWRTFLDALRLPKASQAAKENDDQQIPNSWWLGGLVGGSVLTMIIADFTFSIPWYLSLVAIALSSVLAAVGTRAVGETDMNPVGGMGKVTQLVFAGLAPGQMSTNLMAAAITAGGASQAADMMQDLKTGHLLGASPRKLLIAQLAGISMGVFLCVPAYVWLTRADELGSKDLPAPAAVVWKAMAELLAEGMDALPPHCGTAVLIAAAIGAVIAVCRKIESLKAYAPSGLAIGIAFIITADHSLTLFYGLCIWWIWKRWYPDSAERYTYAAAAGLIAGQGLMGIVNAGLKIREVPTLF
jgi:uncharacterized oligopeptide transporter (OPT) family protein